jgi:hypothetical protein
MKKILFYILFFASLTTNAQDIAKKLAEIKKNPLKIKTLDLSESKLKEIPSEITACKNLEELIIHSNQIKKIPDFVGELTKLKKLDFYNNQLKDLPQNFENLQNLERIDLGNNQFTTIPNVIFKLKNLKKLYIYGNSLKNIPNEIGNLTNLEELRIGKGLKILFGGNTIKKLPESIGNLTELKELHAPDTRLRELPNSFKNLQKLEHLELANVQLKKLPPVFEELPRLKYVSLWDNRFSATEKNNLAQKKPQLKTLYDKKYEGNFWAVALGIKQGNFTEGNIGIAKAFKKDFLTISLQTSLLYQIQNQKIGGEIGGQFNSLISVGVFTGYWYSQSFFVRPQIGIGRGKWSLTYNYDFNFGKETEILNQHSIKLAFLLPFKPYF